MHCLFRFAVPAQFYVVLLFVVLFLEGTFGSDTRPKSAIMKRIRDTLETKLDWLNCKVSVEDINTYRKDEHALYHVERMP